MNHNATIELRQAGFRFAESWIYRHYSFAVETGEIVAILGPNGRGKTTLLKAMIGLLPLAEGSVEIAGEVGYVPQHATTAFDYSALDIVVMGRARHVKLFQVPTAEDFAIAQHALASLNLSALSERPFNQLSGGERQLVLIARALASECEILILDEPTSALDFHNQDKILQILTHIVRERGLTVLFSTHYPQHALHLADKVLLMHSPEHYQFGPTSDIMSEQNLQALYALPIREVRIEHGGQMTTTVIPIFSRPA